MGHGWQRGVAGVSVALAVIVAAWLLYHGLRWSRGVGQGAALPPASPRTPPSVGQVTFLVAAWNAAAEIPAFVQAFRALSYPRKDLVLCAGGRDGSLNVARALEGADLVVVEQGPGEGKQRALRRGFPQVRGDVVYLTDVDCQPDDAAVDPLLRALGERGVEAATGIVRPLPNQASSPFVRAQWAITAFHASHASQIAAGLHGANAAVYRTALGRSGGFAQEAPSGTDYTLAKELLRGGATIAFCSASAMPTSYPENLPVYVRKQARWLRNVAVLGARYGAWGEVRAVVITMLIPCVIIMLLIGGLWYWESAALAVMLLLHSFLNRLYYLRFNGQHGFQGAAETVVADLLAALLASQQALRRQMNWS